MAIYKSVFMKYLMCFLLIFSVSFTALFVIIVGTVSSNERESSTMHAAESVKVFVERSYAEYISTGKDEKNFDSYLRDEDESLVIQLSGIADCTNTSIFITTSYGTISAVSNGSNLRAKKIPSDIIEKVLSDKDGYKFTGDLGGLLPTDHYIEGIELSTGDLHGYIFACASLDGLSSFVAGILGTMIWISVLVIIAGMIGCYFISKRISVPLREMSQAAKSFSQGDFSVNIPVVGNDEVAELALTMNSMAESLNELENMRNSFLSNVSHELRTPMTTISGVIEGILDGAISTAEQDHYLEIVLFEVKRLSRLVNSLLDISRIQAGSRKFEIREFDICETARKVLISNEGRINDKKLDVEFDCEEDNMYAMGDIDAVHQVTYNIIDNAIKFSYIGGKLRIDITRNEDKTISLGIYNEGIGIPEEDLKHVFDRFYKADKSRGLDKTGVGLGMYITRTIIEAINGNIGVESIEGKWCKFTFTLPDSGRISASAVIEGD